MSGLTDIVVFCEGVAGGPDIRLLEAARNALLGEHPIAELIELRPSGSVGDLEPLLRLNPAAFAVRDRDFMPRDVVEQQRAKLGRAFPLSRHSIESYLVEPSLFAGVTGVGGQALVDALSHVAEILRWAGVARGVVQQFVARHRLHPALGRARATQRDEAVGEVALALSVFEAKVGERLAHFDVTAEVDALHADFERDGPLWGRVDGKALIAALRRRLDPHGARWGRGLVRRLVDQGERTPPGPLVDDLRQLCDGIAAARAWAARQPSSGRSRDPK